MLHRWVLAVLLLGGIAFAQEDIRRLYDRARLLAERNQNLTEAIRLYGEVVRRAKDQRVLAARSQFQQGVLYERLGRGVEALAAFRAVVTDFSDQADLVRQARARLGPSAPPLPGMTDRLVVEDSSAWLVGPSADGRYLAFTDWETGDLAVRDLRTGEQRRLTKKQKTWKESTAQALGASFSPQGDRIAYQWLTEDGRYELRMIRFDGSGDRLLFSDPKLRECAPVQWSADGKRILVRLIWGGQTAQIAVVTGPSGEVTPVTQADDRWLGTMAFSPDGKSVAYTAQSRDRTTGDDIFLVSDDASREIPLLQGPANETLLGWSPGGHFLIFTSDRLGTMSLWGVAFDGERVAGEPKLFKQDVGQIWPLGITRAGALFYSRWSGLNEVYVGVIDPESGSVISAPRRITRDFSGYGTFPSWSPDGDQLLLYQSGLGFARPKLAFYSNSTRKVRAIEPRLLRVSPRPQWYPPGGAVVVRGTDPESRSGYFKVDPATGDADLLLSDERAETTFEGAWSSDGKTFYNRFARWKRGLFRLNIDSGERTTLFVPPDGANLGKENLALSPDEHFLAFHLQDYPAQGRSSMMVIPVAGGEAKALYTIENPDQFAFGAFAWSPDMKYIYALHGRDGVHDIWRVPTGGGAAEKIGLGAMGTKILRLNPDGRTIAFQAGATKTEVWVLEDFLPPLAKGG